MLKPYIPSSSRSEDRECDETELALRLDGEGGSAGSAIDKGLEVELEDIMKERKKLNIED